MRAERVISYYGSKYRLAPKYDTPKHRTIIEPFAGGAGYSLHYPEYDVRLYDLNEKLCAVWEYVINVDPDEIRKLPLIGVGASVDDYDLTQEQRWLIGWWVANGVASPQKKLTGFTKTQYQRSHKAKTVWTSTRRELVAQTSERIKHWKIEQRSYDTLDNDEATWFIDPPYQCKAGRHYKHNDIDFEHLATWCRSRRGQVQVCENTNSEMWLPFEKFHVTQGAQCKTTEAIWRNYEHRPTQPTLFDVGGE